MVLWYWQRVLLVVGVGGGDGDEIQITNETKWHNISQYKLAYINIVHALLAEQPNKTFSIGAIA